MKYLKIAGLAVVIMLIMAPAYVMAEGLGNARLSLVEGDVQIRSEDSPDWFPVSVNMPLRDGDSIWVPDGARAEVQLIGGTQVRLDERTSLDLLAVSRDSSQFYLAEGSAYVNFRGGRGSSLIQVDTPLSSARAYERAAFNIDVAERGNTEISVYEGLVYADSRSGSIRVTAGNVLEMGEGFADLIPLGRADAWERWNTDRNRRFEQRGYSSRYLPDELETYASDFDDYGRWRYVSDYGYVWTPTVYISAGWSPYRNGRWNWIGSDYVWIGYEPWGWAPYHYGRWAYAASVGWFWVPPARGAVYWGPGYVGWVRTPSYVAWVPLAPREIYYGYGYYGPHSVNLINVNINTVVVKSKYRNIYVKNGYTAVHHDTFVKGKHVDLRIKDNPFLREKVLIGRPDIKPERESRMSVIREIPGFKEPPKKIREIRIREIKEARPIVRERDKSVFSPDRPLRQMSVKDVKEPRERKRDKPEERFRERDRDVTETEPADSSSQKREQEQSDRPGSRPELPRQKGQLPERTKERELRTPDEDRPELPRMRQREQEPALNRQMQRDNNQQKQQPTRPTASDREQKKDKKEKDKKAGKDQEEQEQQPSGQSPRAPR